MALSESALSDLLAALTVGEGTDLVRELAQFLLQELIEVEATAVIGAGRFERGDGRTTERNGHRPRVLSTKAGDLNVGIPKLRRGSFFPSLLEPRRRIDQALYAVVMEAYVAGVSTRSVDDLVEALGVDTGISKSEVSRICAGLDERVAAFRNRTLGHVEFPYVYLDATYVHVRDDRLGQVVSRAVVIATGVTAEGGREVLGVDVGDSEDETFWTGFLRSLRARGLSGVRLVISDAHAGLHAAIRRCFSGTSWQRCRVHFARINRPSGVGQDVGDAGVAGAFAGPAASVGVVVEVADVVELFGDDVDSGGVGDEVVALLTDVRVGAGVGDRIAGAEAVSETGLDQLGVEPVDLGRDGGASAGGNDEQRSAGADLARGGVVGGTDGG